MGIFRFTAISTMTISLYGLLLLGFSMATDRVINVCDEKNSENSFIFCHGKLLESVNYHNLYPDSKTFVDMPLKFSPIIIWPFLDKTLTKFLQQFPMIVEKMDERLLAKFVDEHFLPAGSELKNCTPVDWREKPPQLMKIKDENLRKWALALNEIWKHLCKYEKYSLIYVPYHFIAPGGRFREFYYWDAYWIIKGLLSSGMTTSARLMIQNFVYMIEKYTFVPNGGRVYYLRRSQPPLFIPMVYEYYEKTRDMAFVRSILPAMRLELNFWLRNRRYSLTLPDGSTHRVFRYAVGSNVPRPESYREDVIHAQSVENKRQFWTEIASAAESGWDFSSRWFNDQANLSSIEITRVLPVDLNAIMCWNMDILQYLYEQAGNATVSNRYRNMRTRFRRSLKAVFYNGTMGTWYDFNMHSMRHNTDFYLSMTVPLFTGCHQSINHAISKRLFERIKKSGALDFPGGVPTSLYRQSLEQWDFPNGWSPLNHMVVEALRKADNAEMQNKAFLIAHKWVVGNYRVFVETGRMWEKYNVIGTIPHPGSGGEYRVQDGFGWTNGVILDLLTTYGDRLTLPSRLPSFLV